MNSVPQSVETSRPVDLDELHDRCLGRSDLVQKVLADFQDFLTAQLQELDAAFATEDLTKLQATAHRLKGASLTVSARVLSQCAHRLQSLAAAECTEEIKACINNLRAEATRLDSAVKSYYGES